jgi:DNA-directed RNA polymerase specialized sigma24 family protein
MDQNQESVRVAKEAAFSTTHWTMILAAGEGDSERKDRALASLCKSYWYPIYAFVRREGHSPHDAQDVTQGFFARLLADDGLQGLDRTRGKFWCFFLASLKNYLIDLYRRSGAEKRGGKSVTFSIDDEEAEARFNREPSVDTSPDKLFERLWVVTLLERVMAVLSGEQKGAGKGHVFESLQHHISKEPGGILIGLSLRN